MRVATLVLALGLAATPAVAADLVLHHGRIWTGDPQHPAATAIAIEGNRIVAVGSDAQVLALADADTRRIDLGGRRVVPGINDAHTHLTRPLPGEVLDLPRDADAASVRAAIAALPGGGDVWISADIDIPVLHDPGMRRAQLDALQPTRPMLLTAWTGHGMLEHRRAAGPGPGGGAGASRRLAGPRRLGPLRRSGLRVRAMVATHGPAGAAGRPARA